MGETAAVLGTVSIDRAHTARVLTRYPENTDPTDGLVEGPVLSRSYMYYLVVTF